MINAIIKNRRAVRKFTADSVSADEIKNLIDNGAVGEAFGCYFSKDSKIISETTAIGIKINDAKKIKTHIAVAAGKNKVESIISTEFNDVNGVLVTDEATAQEILEKLEERFSY